MSKTKDQKGNPLFYGSPNQAAKIFGLDQERWDGSGGATVAAPRPKFLFLIRFVRGPGAGSAVWKDGLTFAVKSCTRPTLIPQLKELNQYNKKRYVQTGIKYEQVNIEFHDTVDAVVNKMWQEYSSYYFGDFRHQDQYDWSYDATMIDFKNQGQGFGASLPPGDKKSVSYLEAGNFFERLECYQLFAGSFTRFDLVHPKISRYDPDDMTYESGSHGIRMSMEYEAIISHKNGSAIPMSASSELTALFGGILDGNVFAPPTGAITPSINALNIPFYGNISRLLTKIPSSYINGVNSINKVVNTTKQIAQIPETVTGVLGSFGSFNFGSGGTSDSTLSDVISRDSSNLGSNNSNGSPVAPINRSMSPSRSISGAAYDVAKGAAEKFGTASNTMIAALIGKSNPRDALSILNNARESTSQVGIRTQNSQNNDPNDLI